MASNTENSSGQPIGRWRAMGWGGAASLLLLPLVAMQFTDEVNWTIFDFVFAAILIGGVGLLYELAVRMSPSIAYRAAVGIALAATFLLIWVHGAVGIIGDSDNPANLMFAGVLAIAAIGSILAAARAAGMARVMAVTAGAQLLVAMIALIAGFGAAEPPGPIGILALNGVFAALWLVSAWLFRSAARGRASAGVAA